ncbi:uncharacterized protein [Epargyreus clarus]|uniref:uncharacterized protein n=1 Tax=Epargyreus clarus TaxID=520877 RepID=UPI003C306FA7
MKAVLVTCFVVVLILEAANARPNMFDLGDRRCVNMWDEGCINGQLPGAGGDDDYLNGGFNPGKRCVNVWDDGCVNGQLIGAGNDDNYLGGSFTPGKRSLYELLSKLQKKRPL